MSLSTPQALMSYEQLDKALDLMALGQTLRVQPDAGIYLDRIKRFNDASYDLGCISKADHTELRSRINKLKESFNGKP